MSDINNQIKNLEQQLANLKQKQHTCNHVFGEVKYNPYEKQEIYCTGRYEYMGVHMWPETSSRPITVPRWTKACTECGFEQHTEKQKVVSVQKAPDFG